MHSGPAQMIGDPHRVNAGGKRETGEILSVEGAVEAMESDTPCITT